MYYCPESAITRLLNNDCVRNCSILWGLKHLRYRGLCEPSCVAKFQEPYMALAQYCWSLPWCLCKQAGTGASKGPG